MSKKVMLIALSIALAAALVGGATMAWFSDSEASGPVEFTAGTVQIEAGTAVAGPDAEMGYGWQLVNVFPEKVVSSAQGTLPNGGNVQSVRSNPNAVLELNEGQAASNFFSLGYEMDEYFNSPGDPETQQYWSGHGGEIVVKFAERVWVSEGRLILVVEDTWGSWPLEKAEVYVSQNNSDWTYAGAAVNGTGTPQSYSHITVPTEVNWFQYVKVIDVTNPYDFMDRWSSNDNDAFDLNTIMVQRWEKENWNPGDCDEVKYIVRNSGTKNSHVRAKFSGYWLKLGEAGEWIPWTPPADVVTFAPCDGTPWEVYGEDGYLYYTAVLAPNEIAELCLQVCLDGPDTGNAFQGKRFVVTGDFEAIQASHGASGEVWNWSPVE